MPHTKRSPSTWKILRNRVIAGLFVVLPFFITFFVIKWLYDTFVAVLIGPISNWLISTWFPESSEQQTIKETFVEIAGTTYRLTPEGVANTANDPTSWMISFVAALAAFAMVIGVLFIAGMFFRSRLHKTVDWVLSTVPGVNTVYNAVSNVIDAISRTQGGTENFKRVVLIQFPHPGMKVPAFVTSDCKDLNTGRDILTVYVPTTPIPTSGYMILVSTLR